VKTSNPISLVGFGLINVNQTKPNAKEKKKANETSITAYFLLEMLKSLHEQVISPERETPSPPIASVRL
jgi:hypothetical protein